MTLFAPPFNDVDLFVFFKKGECSGASEEAYIWCHCGVDGGHTDTCVGVCGGPGRD